MTVLFLLNWRGTVHKYLDKRRLRYTYIGRGCICSFETIRYDCKLYTSVAIYFPLHSGSCSDSLRSLNAKTIFERFIYFCCTKGTRCHVTEQDRYRCPHNSYSRWKLLIKHLRAYVSMTFSPYFQRQNMRAKFV